MMNRYLVTANNISAGHLEYTVVEATTIEEATDKMNAWCEGIIQKHPLVVFEDKKAREINDDLEVTCFTKTNGYTLSEEFNANIKEWEAKLHEVFENELMIITHFYYGDKLDMADVILKDRHYMHYSINAKHIRCEGHECSHEQKVKFESLEK